ncbi:unnamed protein product [Gadus morhua 'NCC']
MTFLGSYAVIHSAESAFIAGWGGYWCSARTVWILGGRRGEAGWMRSGLSSGFEAVLPATWRMLSVEALKPSPSPAPTLGG